jgi:membrane glycosyltransferase
MLLATNSWCGGTGNYQQRIWLSESFPIHKSILRTGLSHPFLTSLWLSVVAKLLLQSSVHALHISALFFQHFRDFCQHARQVSTIKNWPVKDSGKCFRMVAARGNAVEPS